MDQELRNKLRNVVTQCRKRLEDAISQELEGKYGIFARKDQVTADPNAAMSHLSDEDQASRRDILDHLTHIKARGFKPKESLDQLVREIAFTHLNRLCAYKMMDAREVYVGGQKFREAVSRGVNSNGVKFYLAEHEDDERLFNTGQQDVAYRHFLDWLGGTLSNEIGVLFNPNDPANRLYPRQKTLDEILDLLNGGGIKAEETKLREQWLQIWAQDETIGWVYQYFTPKELRDQARKESQAPRNSYELAFRNQFFTPRYVVEFLTDNTLGRTWYEMRKGDTQLKDQCRYLVRRPTEIFLKKGQPQPSSLPSLSGRGAGGEGERDDLSQEELLKLPVHIPHRPKKDPRELKILDPACGSGHFLLYCFDLLLTIYEEAYADPDLGPALQKDYPKLEDLRRDVPRLILAHNLHGIDIDLRASQIAALALWLRCQRAYQDMGLKKDRPKITRSNFVCAEPMPGEESMLKEFVGQLEPKVLGQVVEVVFEKMKLAGEAGSLLKIEAEIRDAVAAAKKQWVRETRQALDHKGQPLLFTQADWDQLDGKPEQQSLFDFSDLTDAQFFENAETRVIEALRSYAEKAQDGQRLQRRLFTDDAVRGFGFVDLCQKRYDVVLMNPPFGKSSNACETYYNDAYSDFKLDIGIAFVDRFLDRLCQCGSLGAITSRTYLASDSMVDWRLTRLLRDRPLHVLLDLGYGVLDEAMVEAACLVADVESVQKSQRMFVRALEVQEKEAAVKAHFVERRDESGLTVFSHDLDEFHHVPLHVICYWLPRKLLQKVATVSPLVETGGAARHGLVTTDDFRFLRLVWEVAPSDLGRRRRWCLMAKGGEYQPYWDDLHLAIDWLDDGGALKEYLAAKRLKTQGSADWSPWLNHHEYYFIEGLTYPERTTSDFCPRCLPRDVIFSSTGQAIQFATQSQSLAYLSGSFTRLFKLIVESFVGSGDNAFPGSAAKHYRSGLLNKLPAPLTDLDEELHQAIQRSITHFRSIFRREETSRDFMVPVIAESITSAARANTENRLCGALDVLETHAVVESLVHDRFQLATEDHKLIDGIIGPHPLRYETRSIPPDKVATLWNASISDLTAKAISESGARRQVTKKAYIADRKLELIAHLLETSPKVIAEAVIESKSVEREVVVAHAQDMLSYCVGVTLRRWDVRFATSGAYVCEFPNPFCPLPDSPPGALEDGDGAPVNGDLGNYPLRIEKDGILPDDIDRPDDFILRVRDILELIWKDRADAIEKEACEILGVKELRDYFRKPGKGGFWDDHISRYSKSRRKAPIYWLLQSSKKNYALWLYYHRLDKDLLFKALINYVEPKIRLETSRLETLRNQKTAAGDSGKEAKRLAKDIERQDDFLSELRDFEDKLRRAANLHLEPDLNDGVVLNIAPLHELVPWKEARKYWDELLAGKYEWSSIGQQLRQKRLVS